MEEEDETLYEKRQKRKEKRQYPDSRGDSPDNGQTKKKNGFLARIRNRNSREEREQLVAPAVSLEFDALTKSCSTEPWEGTIESAILPKRDDSAQRTATYRQFGGHPLETIKVEETSQIPVPSTPDHVLVKVTVSA